MAKGDEEVEFVYFTEVFACPQGHEITVPSPWVDSPTALRDLKATLFSLECPRCKWEGQRFGHQALSIVKAGQNHKTD